MLGWCYVRLVLYPRESASISICIMCIVAEHNTLISIQIQRSVL